MNLEVKTMPSEMSSSKGVRLHFWFHPTLYRKNMTRFWPIWALYTAICFLTLTVPLLTQYGRSGDTYGFGEEMLTAPQYFARFYVFQIIPEMAPIFSFCFGILAAMAVFSYLFQSRSAGLIHALPVRREALFFTNYLSGLSFFALPLLAVFLLTLALEVFFGAVYFPGVFNWLFVNLFTGLFFYSFAVFCAMFTGHILALPAFYSILNVLAAGLTMLLSHLFGLFVYGFSISSSMEHISGWLTPLVRLLRSLNVEEIQAVDGIDAYCLQGLFPVFVYAAVGLLLTVSALVVYLHRHLECAGDVVSPPQVRPVFRYGVAFCAALSLGTILYHLFFAGETDSPWLFLLFLLIGGMIGYFAAEMLLQKSFRVFHSSWKGFSVFSLILIAGIAAIRFDLTGFERWVPDPDQISSVEVQTFTFPTDSGNIPLTLTTPEDIELATRLHAAIVTERTNTPGGVPVEYSREEFSPPGTHDHLLHFETGGSASFDLSYTTIGGQTIFRQYTVALSEERLKDPNSAASLLNEIVNRPALMDQSYFQELYEHEGSTLTSVSMSFPEFEVIQGSDGWKDTAVTDREITLDLNAAGRQALLDAIRADIAAGRLHRYLMDSRERNTQCYYNDLILLFERHNSEAPSSLPSSENPAFYITISLQAGATQTLRVLEQYGVDPNLLISRIDYQIRR